MTDVSPFDRPSDLPETVPVAMTHLIRVPGAPVMFWSTQEVPISLADCPDEFLDRLARAWGGALKRAAEELRRLRPLEASSPAPVSVVEPGPDTPTELVPSVPVPPGGRPR